jgi:hypothetical protein
MFIDANLQVRQPLIQPLLSQQTTDSRVCGLQAAANPQGLSSWADTEGQNFVADHASPKIDFMAIHLWMNNW